jgi:hypothetical protein
LNIWGRRVNVVYEGEQDKINPGPEASVLV